MVEENTEEESNPEQAENEDSSTATAPSGSERSLFWERLFAALVDWLILGLLLGEAILILMKSSLLPGLAIFASFLTGAELVVAEPAQQLSNFAILASFFSLAVLPAIYFACFESSLLKASPGKLLAMIEVECERAEKLSLLSALLRFLLRYSWLMTGLIFIFICQLALSFESVATVLMIVAMMFLVFFVSFPFAAVLASAVFSGLSHDPHFVYDSVAGTTVLQKAELPSWRRALLILLAMISLLFNPLLSELRFDFVAKQQPALPTQPDIGEILAAVDRKTQTEPSLSPSPSPSSTPNPEDLVVSKGFVRQGDNELQVTTAYALRTSYGRSIEIAFFQEELSSEQIEELKELRSFEKSSVPDPVIWLTFFFHDNYDECDIPAVRSFLVGVRLGEEGLQSDYPGGKIEFSRAGFEGRYKEVNALACDRWEERSRIVANIVGEGSSPSPKGRIRFEWDLLLNARTIN